MKLNENAKKYIFCLCWVFALVWMLLIAATIITRCEPVREAFNDFFNTIAMTWEEAKTILIVDYIISLPVSVLYAVPVYWLIED